MIELRQILYVSSAAPRGAVCDVDAILSISRRNNARAGVTGLLYTDGTRFLQVLEGEPAAIDATLGRIRGDARHQAVVVLSDRTIQRREFGHWSMARRGVVDHDALTEMLAARLAEAAPQVRATFLGLVSARDAQERALRVA